MSPSELRQTQFLCVGIVACLAIATHAWCSPSMRGRRLFALGTYSACAWMLGDLVGRCSETFGVEYAAELLRYVGVVNVPVWMFAFTRAYCGRALSQRAIGWLLAIPALSLGMVATTGWHGWFFSAMRAEPGGLATEFGPYFWYVHMPYCYMLSALSVVLVLAEVWRVPAQFRRQLLILLVSLSVPFAINIADLLGWAGATDKTALGFPVFALLMTFGIFRHHLLSVNPIAYEQVFQQMHDGVVILSKDDRILDINETAAQQAGKPRAALLGMPVSDAFAGYPALVRTLRDRATIVDALAQRGPDAAATYHAITTSNFAGISGGYDGRIVTLRDMTVVRQYQQSLEELAYVDPLTGLANRRRFEEEVDKALQRASRRGGTLAVLYFDLNRFKAVNDSLGHAIGDELLAQVSTRASAHLRAPDFVARLGGDEFVVLLHDTTGDELPVVVERLRQHVERPAVLSGHTLTPRLSLGAALYPQDGATLHELLRHADAAMYQAKARGRDVAHHG